MESAQHPFERPPPDRLSRARLLVVPAMLGSAVIHAAATPPHFDSSTAHGVAFVMMAALLGFAALAVLVHPSRSTLVASLVVNVGIVALWVVSRTTGLPGEAAEAVGFADAVATALEVAAIASAVAALTFDLPRRRLAVPAMVSVGAVAALAVAALVAVDDHDHAHGDGLATGAHDHTEADRAAADAAGAGGAKDAAAADPASSTPSISRVFAGADHGSHSGGTGNAHFHDRTTEPCQPTDPQVAAADGLVAATTLALLRFRDPQAAVDAGYRPLGFEPNGVHHYLHAGYRDDGAVLDPARPESILYGRTADGALHPVGAMYMMATPNERGPRVGGCLTPWHAHGFPFAPPGKESAEMMHVWTIPVPGGPFAEHVEGEYARLYLDRPPLDVEAGLRQAGLDDGPAAATGAPSRRRGMGIGALLNSLNVHREVLCSPTVRPMLSKAAAPAVVERICDPVMNGPLPGAEAPPLAELAAAFADEP